MARGMRLWIAAAIGACLVIAVAYLPPRGGVREPPSPFRLMLPQLTPARLRAQALADAWRAAAAEVRLQESRARLDIDLARLGSANGGPALLIDGPDSAVSFLGPTLRAELETTWRRLGLGVTKVAVVVVVHVPGSGLTGGAAPPEERGGGAAYLLPDSTDRTTCVVVLQAGYWILDLLKTRRLRWAGQFRTNLKDSFGPCAFYAAYGNPSKPVRHWLANRNFDLALSPVWDEAGNVERTAWWLVDSRSGRWWWEMIYRLSPSTVGCLAGRATECKGAVLDGVDYAFDDSLPRVVVPGRRWWLRQGLVPGERYLADVARDVGHDRFLRFWNSPFPVDTSLAEALKMPIGRWTERWERRYVRRVPLGPAAPRSASLLAMLLGAVAVTTVALTAQRRQVR